MCGLGVRSLGPRIQKLCRRKFSRLLTRLGFRAEGQAWVPVIVTKGC